MCHPVGAHDAVMGALLNGVLPTAAVEARPPLVPVPAGLTALVVVVLTLRSWPEFGREFPLEVTSAVIVVAFDGGVLVVTRLA